MAPAVLPEIKRPLRCAKQVTRKYNTSLDDSRNASSSKSLQRGKALSLPVVEGLTSSSSFHHLFSSSPLQDKGPGKTCKTSAAPRLACSSWTPSLLLNSVDK